MNVLGIEWIVWLGDLGDFCPIRRTFLLCLFSSGWNLSGLLICGSSCSCCVSLFCGLLLAYSYCFVAGLLFLCLFCPLRWGVLYARFISVLVSHRSVLCLSLGSGAFFLCRGEQLWFLFVFRCLEQLLAFWCSVF
jgi:hypothetical protein